MKRLLLVLAWFGSSLCLSTSAQVPSIDDSFDSNPCSGGGWICQGSAVWVPPLSEGQSCELLGIDPNKPFGDGIDDCTLYPAEGYVLLTPGQLGQSGNLFRQEKARYDNFKMTVVVEMRDGTISRPADGMCVVIAATDDGNPPGLGASGGGMGATGLSSRPTMIFEFDNWSGNASDQNDENHVGFTWSKTGFPAVDAICSPNFVGPCRNDVFVKIDEQLYPLNNKQPPPAPSNRFQLTVFVQNGTVACDLKAIDVGHDFGRVYTYKIPDFAPFLGYLGVTASTGGATQNQIVHSVKVEELPPGFCLAPPGNVSRSISGRRDPRFACGDFGAGDTLSVKLKVLALRVADANCGATASIVIREMPPAGWTPFSISDGGSYNSLEGVIQWTINKPSLTVGKTVSYSITATDVPEATVSWSGTFADGIPLSAPQSIAGDATLLKDTPLGPCGGIKCWNVLGAFTRSGGGAPGDPAIRLDYLTDGLTHESDFVWYPGAKIDTAFNGDGFTGSAATGVVGGSAGRNPSGFPEVFAWNDPDGLINLNDDVFGGDPNNVMAYSQTYVVNTTPDFMEVHIGSSSDDSIQVFLNGEEVWIHNIARAGSTDCAPLDVSPDGVSFFGPYFLRPGENSLVVKTLEGFGGWDFSVRFQDELGIPITHGLEIRKVPEGACIFSPFQATRDVVTAETTLIEDVTSPKWSGGATYDVTITLSNIRAPSASCPAPTSADIVETAPIGWAPFGASDGGVMAGNTITWHLTDATILEGKVLTYKAQAPEGSGAASFTSRVSDPSVASPSPVAGDRVLYNPQGFASNCFIQEWLLLGPYKQPGLTGASPGVSSIRRDHLTDGAGITEKNVEPRAGDTVSTAYGAARSTGLETTNRSDLNPNGVPTWFVWTDADDTIDFTTVCRRDVDQVMFYAVTYVSLDAARFVDIGLASDDSVQVLLDGKEIWINNIPRDDGGPNAVEDVIHAASTPALNPLPAGRHKLMVKVFDGTGQNTFRLRLQDPNTGLGLCDGIVVCLDPNPTTCDARPRFLRGDSNGDGDVLLGDAVNTLNFLFRGTGTISCKEAADADDNGIVQLTDAVRTLNYLYAGGAPIGGLYPGCEIGSPACVYPVSPCGPGLTRKPQPVLRLDFEIERVVEEGQTTNPVTGTVRLMNTEPADFSLQGWSLSVRPEPQPLCSIQRATVEGTLGDREPIGLRSSGFEKTELVLGAGDHGAVSSVILSFTELVTLPGNNVPHSLLKLDLGAPFPAAGCVPCRLEFFDGLVGSGQPVKNIVDVGGTDVQPFSRPVEVRFCSAITPIVPGGAATNFNLSASDPNVYFKLEPKPPVGSVLTLSLDGSDSRDSLALYVRWGAIPSPTELDLSADARGHANQRLVIPFTREDTCFVLARGNVIHGAAAQAAFSVTMSTLALERVSSNCGQDGCSGQFHLAVQGGGFDSATTFALEPSPAQSIAASSALIVSDERAELVFVVPGTPEGAYDLVARKTVGQTTETARLDDAVRVTRQRIGPRLEASMVAPVYYREGGMRRMTLRYSNTGDAEMPAPIFEVSGPSGTLLGIASDTGVRPTDIPNFSTGGVGGTQLENRPLQLLGINPAGVAGRLPPGASGEIVVLLRHPNPFNDPPGPNETLELVARRVDPNPGSGVAWSSLATPAGLTPAEWSSLWPGIAAKYGADYNEALAEIAARLTRRGVRTAASVKDLIRFAVLEARLRPSAVILGLARGPDKTPLPSRKVAALLNGVVVACATTDFEGSFALGPLANGVYLLAIEGFATTPTSVSIAGSADKLPVVLEALSQDGSSIKCPLPATEQNLPESAPGLPQSILKVAATVALKPAVSEDPNTKDGPDETFPAQVTPGQRLSYTIYFENCPPVATKDCPTPARAAARQVLVADALPDFLDADSIVFTECQIGKDKYLDVSGSGGGQRSTGYTAGSSGARYSVTAEQEISVSYPDAQQPIFLLAHMTAMVVITMDDLKQLTYELCSAYQYPPPTNCVVPGELTVIEQGIAAGKRFAVWSLDTRVPLTASLDTEEYFFDDRIGFLPPNDPSPSGEGHVSFDVDVSANAPDGEKIENIAHIVFDNKKSSLATRSVQHTVKNPKPRFIRGDCNGDGKFGGETADIKFLLLFNFNAGATPPCLAACDANGDGKVTGITADAIYMINFLFIGTGPAPPPPYPACGPGNLATDDALGCESPPVCR